jgi:hypothetical protein
MAYTLGTVTFTTIKKEKSRKDSQLFSTPLPGSDSDETIVLDLFGANRTIDLEGTYVGTAAEIKTFIDAFDGLITGDTTAAIIYHTDTSNGHDGAGNYHVYVQTTEWEFEDGVPGKINFTASLIESE